MKIRLTQRIDLPSAAGIDRLPCWVMVFAADYATGKVRAEIPNGARMLRRHDQLGGPKMVGKACTLDLPNKHPGRVAFAMLAPEMDSFGLLTLARTLVAAHRDLRPERLGVLVRGFAGAEAERVAEAVLSAALAVNADLPSYKRARHDAGHLRSIHLYGARAAHRFSKSFAVAEGNALARGLSILPGNVLTPASYLRRLRGLAREHGWQLIFHDQKKLKKKGAGAFLAVAQGSPTSDAGIAQLRYRPASGRKTGKIALVGKGICYDTGGTNLKPASYMSGMHEDMQGSAVALGTLLALTRLGFRRPVDCWLALAMNHIGPKACKPGDVVRAADGTTIEIVHTDAEGRMVLADTLVMASAGRPALIVDYATLTGACIQALGKSYSGIFTNRGAWREALIAAGVDSGERVWPFPLDKDFDEALRSDIADIKQCALGGDADHILAARFLQRFVKPGIPWVHIDLASSHRKGGLAHIPTATTGFGVRYSMSLLHSARLDF